MLVIKLITWFGQRVFKGDKLFIPFSRLLLRQEKEGCVESPATPPGAVIISLIWAEASKQAQPSLLLQPTSPHSLSLQKHRHHSAVETLPSLQLSQELKKGRMQTSYLSRLMAASSAWSRYRSLFVSSFENIQPMESLQLAMRLLSSAVRDNLHSVSLALYYISLHRQLSRKFRESRQ